MEYCQRHPRHPQLKVIAYLLSLGQMRFAMEQANCLVAPSRGEGFGLPVAEAMLLGCPVIATIHGGHADLCSPQWSWPVEFALQPARTHLSPGHANNTAQDAVGSDAVSLWAEPSKESLKRQMREVFLATQSEIQSRTERARRHVLDNYTWKKSRSGTTPPA